METGQVTLANRIESNSRSKYYKCISSWHSFLALTQLVAFVGYDLVLPESLMQISTKATNWVKNRYPFCKPRVFTGTLYR